MIITKLRFKNLKRYKQETEIDLDVLNKEQNIVLLMADNGSWKTSILEGIRWAFFGFEKAEFYKFLNYEAKSSNEAMVLTVEYRDNDFNTCSVTRTYTWSNVNATPNMKFEFRISGVIQDMPLELWDEYLNKNFPREISNFFLFNWAELNSLINPEDPKKVKSAIEKILWIVNIRNLRDNIIEMKSSALKEICIWEVDKKIQMKESQLTEKSNEKNSIRSRIETLKQQQIENSTQKGQLDEKISVLAKQGLTKEKFQERDSLSSNLSSKRIEIAKLDADIEKFKNDYLDKFLLSSFEDELMDQIENEKLLKQDSVSSSLDPSVLEKIVETLYTPHCIVWGEPLSLESKKMVLDKLRKTFSHTQTTASKGEILLDLNIKSESIIASFMQNLKQWNEYRISEMVDLKISTKNILDAVSRSIEELDRSIDETGLVSVNNLIDERDKYIQKITEIALELTDLESSIEIINVDIQRLQRDIEDSMEQSVWLDVKKKYLHILSWLSNILDAYVNSLVIDAKRQLEVKTFEMFSVLINNNIYSKVEISDDYEIKLVDTEGNYQDALNSGHIQILMTSMLWWLEQLSDGFKLPIVIDTPMALLDQKHRKNILEKYFSIAWGQVIILAHTEEIRESDINNPAFSKHFKKNQYIELYYDKDEKQTKVQYINI